MEDISGNKREREEPDEAPAGAPEAKRLRDELFLEILDDDSYPGGEQDLASVIKSLEDEIGLPPVSGDVPQPDLGYLLEASDDELGLPPTVPLSSELDAACVDLENGRFGNIWGSDDGFKISGIEPEETAVTSAGDNGVAVNGEWFDYDDEFYAAVEFSDLQWQESLPAV
ncbi:hypothetical protein HPP92_021854 [Vanilla planifolia]|nr:hypothetical protein HPP92_021854 [Vanilla planifolia]